jgi:hypothetical protein
MVIKMDIGNFDTLKKKLDSVIEGPYVRKVYGDFTGSEQNVNAAELYYQNT